MVVGWRIQPGDPEMKVLVVVFVSLFPLGIQSNLLRFGTAGPDPGPLRRMVIALGG